MEIRLKGVFCVPLSHNQLIDSSPRGLTLSRKWIVKAPDSERDLVARPDGFDIEIYRKQFAPFPWTYVRGFDRLAELLLLQRHFDASGAVPEFIKGFCPQVVPRMPRDWEGFKFLNAHWDKCHPLQIEKIYNGKPASLDHCCHAVVALQAAFEFAQNAVVRTVNVYDYIEFAPAAYVLRNVSDVAISWLKGAVRPEMAAQDQERFAALVKDLCPADGKDDVRDRPAKVRRFLCDVADGFALTLENAQLIKKYVSGPWGSPEIVALKARGDAGRRPAPVLKNKKVIRLRVCDDEGEFVNMRSSKHIELQTCIEAAKNHFGR